MTLCSRATHILAWPFASAWPVLCCRSECLKSEFISVWTSTCDSAFRHLKQALQSAPVLALPVFDKKFTVVCDVCETAPAVGAVLLQDKQPVAYSSRQLEGAEAHHSASDIEMLAVIYAMREWHCYLDGQKFIVEKLTTSPKRICTPLQTHTLCGVTRVCFWKHVHIALNTITNLVLRMWLTLCQGSTIFSCSTTHI